MILLRFIRRFISAPTYAGLCYQVLVPGLIFNGPVEPAPYLLQILTLLIKQLI